jgi:hypothetical protein
VRGELADAGEVIRVGDKMRVCVSARILIIIRYERLMADAGRCVSFFSLKKMRFT